MTVSIVKVSGSVSVKLIKSESVTTYNVQLLIVLTDLIIGS